MKRLKRAANHVGPLSHECVEKDVVDNERIKRRQCSDSYLIAREIIVDSVIAITNENIIRIDKLINEGKFSDLGNYEDHKQEWINRAEDIYREKGIMIKKASNAYSMAEKLALKVPLVPMRELVQDIAQDIQNGLYKNCGDYDTNFEKWLDKCREILRERNVI